VYGLLYYGSNALIVIRDSPIFIRDFMINMRDSLSSTIKLRDI
jgi:hypothetical protein